MALSGAVLRHAAKTYLLFPATKKKKKADHPGTEGRRHLDMEIQHRYTFLFVFENIKLFEYLQTMA